MSSPQVTQQDGAAAPDAGVPRRRVFEVVCDDIRHQVSRGFLRPGDKLPPERELADRLGVSRAAAREALRALEASGILEFRKGVQGGAFIRKASSSGVRSSIADMLSLGRISLEHLSETRSILLTAAARLACERGTDEDFTLLEDNVARSAALRSDATSNDFARRANRSAVVAEFYGLLGQASRNGVLKIVIEAVTDVAREMVLRLPAGSISNLPEARLAIIKALRERNPAKAETLMALHMAELHAYVVSRGGAIALSKIQSDRHPFPQDDKPGETVRGRLPPRRKKGQAAADQA